MNSTNPSWSRSEIVLVFDYCLILINATIFFRSSLLENSNFEILKSVIKVCTAVSVIVLESYFKLSKVGFIALLPATDPDAYLWNKALYNLLLF